MTKTLSLFLLIYFFPGLLWAQTDKRMDSLLLEMKYAAPKDKIELAKEYGHSYYRVTAPQILAVMDEMLADNTLLTPLDSADILYIKSVSSYFASDFEGHLENLEASAMIVENYQGEKDKYYYHIKYLIEGIRAIHEVHGGSVSKALECYLATVEYALLSERPRNIIKAYVNLGSFNINQKDFKSAIANFNKGLAVKSDNSEQMKKYRAELHSELAYLYTDNGQPDSAEYYLRQVPSEYFAFNTYVTQVATYTKKKDYFSAIQLIDSLLNDSEKPKGSPIHWAPFLRMERADCYLAINEYEKAEKGYLQSRLDFLKIKDSSNRASVSERLYNYYKMRGDFEKALVFFEEYKMVNDSMLFENHNAVVKGLQDSKELDSEKKENQKLKEQETLQNSVIFRQRVFGGLGLLFMGLLGGFAFIYFKSAKSRRKLNEELRNVNNELELRNEEVRSRVKELSFISENLPEGIGRLDKNLRFTFFNKYLSEFIADLKEQPQSNIFEVLDIPEKEEAAILQALWRQGELSFSWISENKGQIFQIHIVRVAESEDLSGYLMIMQDVTELKAKEQRKISAVEARLQKLRQSAAEREQEKKALTSSLTEKNKELVSSVMQVSKRNSELESILENLKSVYRESSSSSKLKLSKIIKDLNATLDVEDSWVTFNTYFKEVHPDFLNGLNQVGNNLSNNEIRHCTFIKLGLNNREVADMLKVSSKTVEVARYRIKKKLNLSKEDSLRHFIANVG